MNDRELQSWIVKILPSENAEQAEGTGFWAAVGGYVLTCTHVIADMDVPWVEYEGNKAPAKIVNQDKDIALMQVQGITGETAPFGEEWQREDIIDSIGYQLEGYNGKLGYFPMNGKILGQSEYDNMPTITLEEAIYVKPGASGAPALNRRTGKVIGIISNKWEKQQLAFVLSLSDILKKWEILSPRFHQVSYMQEDIFKYYDTFVGRAKTIETIKKFIQEKGGEYLLIQGKPGMGKTALSVDIARLVERNELGIKLSCLIFINREEGGRNTPEHFLDIINRQLLDLLGIRQEVPISTPEKKRQYQQLWENVKAIASTQNRLLVIIDGLDESMRDGEQPLLEFLPYTITPYIYWILTTRPLSTSALNLIPTTHCLRHARFHELEGFEPKDVQKLLKKFGDEIERSNHFIKQLITKTKGEPLFLRFVCQEIVGLQRDDAEKHMNKIPPKVSEYFQNQFVLLSRRAERVPDEKLSLDIVKMLFVSKSGMTVEELAGTINVNVYAINKGLRTIDRFLLGEDRLELMHLEFRTAVGETLLSREQEKLEVLEKLLSYCAESWQRNYPVLRARVLLLAMYLYRSWPRKSTDTDKRITSQHVVRSS